MITTGNKHKVDVTGEKLQVDDTKLRHPFLPFSKYTYILTVF